MHQRIYTRVKLQFAPVAVALAIGTLFGGGAAYATGKISGSMLRPGTVDESKFTFPLRQKLERLDTVASIDSLNAQERRWEEDIQETRRQIEAQMARDFVKKEVAAEP